MDIWKKIKYTLTWGWWCKYLDARYTLTCGCGDGIHTKCNYTCKCKLCHKKD